MPEILHKDDLPPGIRGELAKAIVALDVQIDGLTTLAMASISPEAKEQVAAALAGRVQRRGFVHAVVAALDEVLTRWTALGRDGPAEMPQVPLPSGLLAELKNEAVAIASAMSVFEEKLPASMVKIIPGSATHKEQS